MAYKSINKRSYPARKYMTPSAANIQTRKEINFVITLCK